MEGVFVMTDVDVLRDLLASQPRPPCIALTPFRIVEADLESGVVIVLFDPQPAFANHFGAVQGGFGVAMIDVVISLASYAKVRQWTPTVEIKSTFVAPLPIGTCTGEGRVIRAARQVVLLEGRLWDAEGRLAVHATATAVVRT